MVEDFEEVYASQVVPVWRFVRARIPREADAEDITSEVFARAMRGWGGYDRRRGTVTAWLLGIARHAVADWWRQRGREPLLDRVPERAGPPELEPETAVLDREAHAELRDHLEVLTDKERDAVALRFGAGLRAAEVGSVLGVSETAARMLVYRAVSKLREVMADD